MRSNVLRRTTQFEPLERLGHLASIQFLLACRYDQTSEKRLSCALLRASIVSAQGMPNLWMVESSVYHQRILQRQRRLPHTSEINPRYGAGDVCRCDLIKPSVHETRQVPTRGVLRLKALLFSGNMEGSNCYQNQVEMAAFVCH